ncbi:MULTISPECIES: hypothetical protein [unclassified Pseudomonas]|uniref:hypothetical protein n=1 Tax=unclassified Pseudomonas TaxID=196821 RepID=UPI0024474163|nr:MULTISPECIES: hypothetical protein [unclassified Pseudomonas]MDG9928215.1 hypothetical protein [Pseudomonas sp. GD04042]MDH0481221.1 hypothetical protein [Pseudomonas sp. GD04015]MDH0605128.1 hypothetical protein [Pseudomonas sp. GD03869]
MSMVIGLDPCVGGRPGRIANSVVRRGGGGSAAQSRADQALAGVLTQQDEGVGGFHGVHLNQRGESWQGFSEKRQKIAQLVFYRIFIA